MAPLMPAPCRMTVVDNRTAAVLHRSYGRKGFVLTDSQRYLDTQDPEAVQRGAFGLDYSEFCDGCRRYHSPEADCD